MKFILLLRVFNFSPFEPPERQVALLLGKYLLSKCNLESSSNLFKGMQDMSEAGTRPILAFPAVFISHSIFKSLWSSIKEFCRKDFGTHILLLRLWE
jgi:hypothetical protein